uniref:ATP synthase F0 subunit 8 n=1 Tax=Thelenota ananas TaxID=306322 RepID=A0A8A3T671_9ECHN|nr:ATP synthase F0 subunit 8 [Thelenota ananas]QTA29882.1 ATP synthase F0 subunit 8 [Thelenota ananas]
MPQLNLVWFATNFLLAWSLITIITLTLNKQEWFSNNEENTSENESINPNITESWNW